MVRTEENSIMKDKICSLFRFSGRVSRLHYFLGSFVAPLVIFIVFSIIAGFTDQVNTIQTPFLAYTAALFFLILLFGLLLCAIVIPLSFAVRRLHDLDHSGWWVLLSFGLGIALLFWKGTKGDNSFGQDPLPLK